jgi:hypothetical protein
MAITGHRECPMRVSMVQPDYHRCQPLADVPVEASDFAPVALDLPE